MSLSMIVMSIGVGLLITKTGRYKGFMVAGTLVMLAGFFLLTRMHYGSSQLDLTLAMIVVGLGLGSAMQTYVLVVQNSVAHRDLGVATAATQFFRSAGGTIGIAILGTIMSSRLLTAIPKHLPPGAAKAMPKGSVDASSVLDPRALAKLPPEIATAVREDQARSWHRVFVFGVPMVLIAVVATLFIKVVPLRETIHGPGEAGRDLLAELGQRATDADDDDAADDDASAAEMVVTGVGAGERDTFGPDHEKDPRG